MQMAKTIITDRGEKRAPEVAGFSQRIGAAAEVAARHADAVDRDGRFPTEAFEELKARQLLGILLSPAFGGEGRSVADAAEVCYALGKACSSTSLIYAMHSANVACLAHHADEDLFDSLRRIGVGQMLLASSTTEGKNGANIRSSAAPIIVEGDRITLDRDASVISYGKAAEVIVTTARRSPESLPGDQALVVFFRENYVLHPGAAWDTMGMRGTCSEGFRLVASGKKSQALAESYDRIHRRSMAPVTHLLWAACWAGIAAGAVSRAQSFIRMASRAQKGAMPPGAQLAAEASLCLMNLQALVDTAIRDYLDRADTPERLEEIAFQTSSNLLKVSASQLAIATVVHAFNACGIAGYRNDSEFSIARALRDILSSSVMINNQRLLSSVVPSCVIQGVPDSLMKAASI